jgi:hypothetical protein
MSVASLTLLKPPFSELWQTWDTDGMLVGATRAAKLTGERAPQQVQKTADASTAQRVRL